MKNKFLVGFLAVVMVMSLVACTGEKENTNKATSGDPTAEVNDNLLGLNGTLSTSNFDYTIKSAEIKTSVKSEFNPYHDYVLSDGKELLFVVIGATNTGEYTDNVMYGNFNAYVDGEKVVSSNTLGNDGEILVGEVDGYMPLFGAVSSGMTFDGYAVWELPEGWETFHFSVLDGFSGDSKQAFEFTRSEISN